MDGLYSVSMKGHLKRLSILVENVEVECIDSDMSSDEDFENSLNSAQTQSNLNEALLAIKKQTKIAEE